MSVNNLFAIATRLKLRFPQLDRFGTIDVEDLWDLPLKARTNRTESSLDSVAQILHDQLEALPKRSFVDDDAATSDKQHTAVRLEIVKAVIQVKKEEAAANQTRVVKQGELSELDALIARKQARELEDLPLEKLLERRAAIASK